MGRWQAQTMVPVEFALFCAVWALLIAFLVAMVMEVFGFGIGQRNLAETTDLALSAVIVALFVALVVLVIVVLYRMVRTGFESSRIAALEAEIEELKRNAGGP